MTAHCTQNHPIEGDNAYTDPSGRSHCKECRARRDRDAYQVRKANRAKTAPIGSQHKRRESGGVQLPVLEMPRPVTDREREAVSLHVDDIVNLWTRPPASYIGTTLRNELLECLGLREYESNPLKVGHK